MTRRTRYSQEVRERAVRLELDSASIPVRFEIVRTQPPTWIRGGGVGVRFLELCGDDRRMIAEALLRLHGKAN